MTTIVSEAAYAYLTDRTVRAAVDEILVLSKSKTQWLPRPEAREFAHAYLMSETVRVEIADLLYTTWESVWEPYLGAIGPEASAESDVQDSFKFDKIFDSGLDSYVKIDRSTYAGLSVFEEDGNLVLRAYLWKDGKFLTCPFDVPSWSHQEESDEVDFALICDYRLSPNALRNDTEMALTKAGQHAAAFVDALNHWRRDPTARI